MLSSRVFRYFRPEVSRLSNRGNATTRSLRPSSASPKPRKSISKLISKKCDYLAPSTIKRFYISPFESRMSMKSSSRKKVDPYADRERGDLSEYRHQIHGLSFATGGRDLAVLKAWDEGDLVRVLDICDDEIESQAYELDADLSSESDLPNSGPDAMSKNSKTNLYIFHRNIKSAALNQLGKWHESIRVANETIRLTKRKDRDALCLKATALNALGNSEAVENRAQYNHEALECFKEALDLTSVGSHDLELKLNYATLLLKVGRANEALVIAQEALNYLVVPVEDVAGNPIPNDDPFADAPELEAQNSQVSGTADPVAYRQAGLDRDHIKLDPDLHMLVTAVYMSTKQFESAIEQCKLGIQALKRKEALGSNLLARFYETHLSAAHELKRYAEAELVAKMLTKIHSTDVEYIGKYFKLMLLTGRTFDEVLTALESFTARFAHDVRKTVAVLEMMLMCHQQFGKAQDSVPLTNRILKFGPHPIAYQMKAVGLLKLTKADEALKVCNEAIEKGLESSEILMARALAYESLQRFDDCLTQYEVLLAKNPNYGPAHFHYAKSLARLGRNAEALVGYDRALASNPSRPEPKVLLAKALLLRDMGRLKEAIETYYLLAKQDPSILKDVVDLAAQFKKENPAAFTSPELLKKVQEMQKSFDFIKRTPSTPSFLPNH